MGRGRAALWGEGFLVRKVVLCLMEEEEEVFLRSRGEGDEKSAVSVRANKVLCRH